MQCPVLLTVSLAALLALTACQPTAEADADAEPVTAAEAGKALYEANCAACHGASGKGDGTAAAGLATAPADLTVLAAGNGGAFPWARVMSQVDGYTRTGAHEVMPDFGDGLSGRTVPFDSGDGVLTPTPVELVELATYVKRLQQ